MVRTPQFSLGDVGDGAAGVSTNSKSPSEVSDADLTIVKSASDVLESSMACSSVLPMNFVEKAWRCGLHHAASNERDTPEPLFLLSVVVLLDIRSDDVRCCSIKSSDSPSLYIYNCKFHTYLVTDPLSVLPPLLNQLRCQTVRTSSSVFI